jgi:hypothetical protein
MSYDHGDGNRFLSPVIPVVYVEVGSADSGFVDSDENIIDSRFWLGNVLQPKAGLGVLFDEGFQ